jgi:hypothetical protein
MADLAVVFHWPPSEMNGMAPEELAMWHQKAMARWQSEEKDGG